MANLVESYQSETVLVTGGLGFVGRNLVNGLLDEGVDKVFVVDDCSNSSPDLPDHWGDRVEHVDTSVVDDDWLDVIPDVSAVFHLACKTLLECHANPVLDAEVNAMSTLRALEKVRRLGDSAPTFTYTSSACVYGVTPRRPVAEIEPLRPSSPYGVSKLTGEEYTRFYAAAHGLSTVALRLSNVYGPGQTPNNPYCGVVGIFLDQARDGQPLTVVGDGEQARDFTYVRDTVRAILLTSKHPAARGEVFNVASGTATSVKNLASEVQQIFPGTEIVHVPSRQIDDINFRQLDVAKIAGRLGWSSTTSFQEGLRHTADWAAATL